MEELKWKRASRNKIVATIPSTSLLVQLTRYKTNKQHPKGTWRLRVLRKPWPWAGKMHEVVSVPLYVKEPTEAVRAAEAYMTVVSGLGEGPLAVMLNTPSNVGVVDEVRFIPATPPAYPKGGIE